MRTGDVFDPTLDLNENAQQKQVVIKVQKALIASNSSDAIQLLRTARYNNGDNF